MSGKGGAELLKESETVFLSCMVKFVAWGPSSSLFPSPMFVYHVPGTAQGTEVTAKKQKRRNNKPDFTELTLQMRAEMGNWVNVK